MSILQLDPFREIEQWLDRQRLWRAPSSMPMDAYRAGHTLSIDLDLPGIDPDKIELTVEQNVLTVKADRSASLPDDAGVVIAERPTGRFERHVILGEQLDPDGVVAEYHDGVLHVTIPIAEVAKARKIEIGSGGTAAIGSGGGAES